jgi:hypothetical protein
MDVCQLRDAVKDERTFVDFLAGLKSDWSMHHSQHLMPFDPSVVMTASWQTTSIGTFLEAAVEAGDASLNSFKHFENPPNHWHRVACILYAGKRYD